MISATLETRIGVVRAMGSDQRFVLIETPSALATSSLSEGQLLHCRREPEAGNHTALADLRVSREHHQALFVANVVAGEPAVGDYVYTTPGAVVTPSPTPVADPISSLTASPLSGLFPPKRP